MSWLKRKSCMARISEFVLNFIANSIWQIPVILAVAGAGSYLLKRGSARHRHTLWLTALMLSIVAPLLSASQLMPDSLSGFQFDKPQFSATTVVPTPGQSSSGMDEPRQETSQTVIPTVGRSRSLPVVNTTTDNAIILTAIYAVFFSCFLIRFVRLWHRKELLRRSISFTRLPEQIDYIATHCRSAFQIQHVAIGRSSLARVPCTLGARRPLIIVPDSYC